MRKSKCPECGVSITFNVYLLPDKMAIVACAECNKQVYLIDNTEGEV